MEKDGNQSTNLDTLPQRSALDLRFRTNKRSPLKNGAAAEMESESRLERFYISILVRPFSQNWLIMGRKDFVQVPGETQKPR
jgi:hypothetical protein